MKAKIKFNLKLKENILKFISCMVISILIFSNVNIDIAKAASILDDIYISEIEYKNEMEEIAEPFIESLEVEGTLKGCEDINLYYRYYLAEYPKASIVISHGFSEYLERYNEIIYYFLKSGYNVFIMEHRGHGRSGLLGQEDKTQVHVEAFDYYIKDFKNFIDNIVIPINGDKKLFLFAHSMGGTIGVNILEEYPEYFDAAVLSAPILLFQAGNDDYVNPGGQDKLNKYAKECKKISVEESKHEFYREVDNIQKNYLENILDFYEKNI